jgi:hypothetical protein
VTRERLNLPIEAVLDAARQRPRARKPEAARQLRRSQSAGQLQQGERVAACLGDDPVPHLRVQPPGEGRGQQRARVALAKS